MAIDPTEAQGLILASTPQNEPVIFINCHKYHDRANYEASYDNPALPPDVSGQEAYHRYLWSVERDFLPQVGGRFLLVGPVELLLIGSGDYHEIVIGEYPSKSEAFRMPTLPRYEDISVHRKAGLESVMTFALNQTQLDRFAIADAWINKAPTE
jgi:uncharacterized protein (DUF1330 family)